MFVDPICEEDEECCGETSPILIALIGAVATLFAAAVPTLLRQRAAREDERIARERRLAVLETKEGIKSDEESDDEPSSSD